MLPMLAMLVGGYMAKQGAAPAGSTAATDRSPQPGLAEMLDLNRDGNVLDDVMGLVGKLFR
jgi:hypothetical protein